MTELYHITKRRHIESILSKGLLPGYRRGMRINGDKCKKVYLTNDPEKIIKWQCGEAWFKKHDCVILTIEVDKSTMHVEPVQYRDGMTYTLSDFEFTIDEVSPYRIKQIKHMNREHTSDSKETLYLSTDPDINSLITKAEELAVEYCSILKDYEVMLRMQNKDTPEFMDYQTVGEFYELLRQIQTKHK